MHIDNIIKQVKQYNNKLIIITGGEPYVQKDVYLLINKLLNLNYNVQMETSGKSQILSKKHKNFKIIMSPKQYNNKFIIYDKKTLKKADYYKFVVSTQNELSNILDFIKLHNLPKNKIYLMAKGATRKEQIKNSKNVVKWCYENQLMYSPRLHVLLYDNMRGV
jgi:7-carboxy-7-deazaguanine synthase